MQASTVRNQNTSVETDVEAVVSKSGVFASDNFLWDLNSAGDGGHSTLKSFGLDVLDYTCKHYRSPRGSATPLVRFEMHCVCRRHQ